MPDSPEPEASPKTSAADALAARVVAFRREQVVVDYAVRGVSTPEIAARLGISVDAARGKLRAALVRTLPESPEAFAALQMNRLNEALLVAFSAMAEMGLKAVDRVLKILRALERCHVAARPLALASDEDAPAAMASSEGRDAASSPRERNQTAAQTPEKAQYRSQTPTPPSPQDASPGEDRGAGPSAGRWIKPGHAEITPGAGQGLETPRFTPDRAEPAATAVARAPGLGDALAAAAP